MESEGNQQSEDDKFNRVDILTQNSKNELIIMEIQNTYEIDYFQRMTCGASKVLTENFKLGQEYREVKKVISINIVYFDFGQGQDYVYKGGTVFKGLHWHDTLNLSERQQTVFAKKSVSDIFPEYYIIKVNDFNDIAKNCLDEWIYFLKNSEVKDEFNAQGLKEAGTILDIMRLNEEEQYGYNRYMEYISYKASEMLSLRLEAEFVVSEERMRNTIEIAKKLLLNGVDESLIAASTGLSVSEIEALRDGLE